MLSRILLLVSSLVASETCLAEGLPLPTDGAAPVLPHAALAPAVFDVPSIDFQITPVEYGVRVNLAQSTSVVNTSFYGLSKTISHYTSTDSLTKRVDELKSSTGGSVKAGLGTSATAFLMAAAPAAGGSPFNLSGSLSHEFSEATTDTNTFSQEDRQTVETRSAEVKTAITQTAASQAYGPNSGYVSFGLTLRNTGVSVATIGSIVVNIVAADPYNVDVPEVIATTCLSSKQLVVDKVIALEPVKTPSVPGDIPAPPTSKGSAAFLSNTASGSICDESQAEFTIAPDVSSTGPTRVSVYVEGLRTDKVLGLLSRKRVLFADISQMSQRLGSSAIDTALMRRLAAREGIRLRIVYPDNTLVERYVDPGKLGKHNTLDAYLRAADLGTIKTDKTNGVRRVARIGPYVSQLVEWGQPDSYTEAELAEGAWVTINQSDDYRGSPYSTPVPPGSVFTIVWLTKRDVAGISSERFRSDVDIDSALDTISTGEPKCGPVLTKGDNFILTISTLHESITTKKFLFDPADDRSYPDQNYKFPGFIYGERPAPHSVDYTRAWGVGIVVPVQATSQPNDASGTSNLLVSTSPNLFTPAEALPGAHVSYDEANEAFIIAFSTSDADAGHKICFRAAPQAGSIQVGRFGSVPPGPYGSLNELLAASGHKKWIATYPLASHQLFMGTKITVIGTRTFRRP